MKWKIFIVTHGPIEEKHYQYEPGFPSENFEFFNVSDDVLNHSTYSVMNKSEISDFIHLGKWFAEAEVIYNIFKLNLFQEYDYIGFVHWDHELKSDFPINPYNISDQIERLIDNGERFISFETYPLSYDFSQGIQMDSRHPNQLFGRGKNCYYTILDDFNHFYGKAMSMDVLMTRRVNLCSAFLMEKSLFEELMPFYCSIIESKKLDLFDIDHSNRFHGVMMERYISCFSSQFRLAELKLKHHYNVSSKLVHPDANEKRTGLGIVFNKIIKKFGFMLTRIGKDHVSLESYNSYAKPDDHGLKWLQAYPIKTVIDIGANTGQFAEMITDVLPNSRLICFEPIAECYAELVERFQHNSSVEALNYALGNLEGHTTMHINDYTPSSSILEMEKLHSDTFIYSANSTKSEIQLRRLDVVAQELNIGGPTLIKIDVQGYEEEVIKGGKETLKAADIVICELSYESLYKDQPSFHQIYLTMQDMGFKYHGNWDQLNHPEDDKPLQGDAIFIKH